LDESRGDESLDKSHQNSWQFKPQLPDESDPCDKEVGALFNKLSNHTKPVMELWDLTNFFVCGKPIKVRHEVKMNALIDHPLENIARVYELTLQHLPVGCGFIRDPRSMFIVCDEAFSKVFSTVEAFGDTKFVLSGDEKSWKDGAIRWRLNSPGTRLHKVYGGSLGGAIACGMMLVVSGEMSDPSIAITAELAGPDLKLKSVDDGSSKIRKKNAARDAGISTVIFADDQAGEGD
jgi:hypothetical protein